MSAVRRLIFSGALAAGVLLGALTLGIASAGAEVTHPFLTSITKANGHVLGQPWGMAFDSSGNLFLADAGERVVDQFASSNTFTAQIGAGDFPETFNRSVAVDQATGVVYVGESGTEEVFVFKPKSGGGYELIQQVKLSGFIFVAVDNSSGPRSGDVYATTGPSVVNVYATDAQGRLKTEGSGTLTPPAGGFAVVAGGLGGLAVDASSGDVYIAEPGHGAVSKYGPEGTLLEQLHGTGNTGGLV